MTLEQAKGLQHRTVLYHRSQRNADGSPSRWRVNGRPRVWKRQPQRVEVPLKHGLYDYDYLDDRILDDLCLTEEEAMKG